jgi:hypothetical protein
MEKCKGVTDKWPAWKQQALQVRYENNQRVAKMQTRSRKLKGYIFKSKRIPGLAVYYDKPKEGMTIKRHAHVYTIEEAQKFAAVCKGWGGSAEGKWIAVYE